MIFLVFDFGWYFLFWVGMVFFGKFMLIEFCYDVFLVNGFSRIFFSINSKDVRDFWESVYNNNLFIFIEEELMIFFKVLELYFYYYFRINLEGLFFIRVRIVIVYIVFEGKFKIVYFSYIDYILE